MANGISFSPWVSWAQRNGLALGSGVYLWARFEEYPPLGPANPLHQGIIYVGQCRTKFKNRWELVDDGLRNPAKMAQFPKKYPRAKRYMEQFGQDTSRLYVATLPVQELHHAFQNPGTYALLDIDMTSAGKGVLVGPFPNPNDDLLVKYMERRLILLYAVQHGHRPVINVE